jgi:predicted molibdopterin-dependent oxidoreductase YjgC
VASPALPAPDSYSVRLVSGRRLYDGGVLLGACGSLGALVAEAVVGVHPLDLEKLGVGESGRIRVRSARGEVVLGAVGDEGVPRGVASIDFNLGSGGTGNGAAGLIDSREPVVDVRMETP